MPVCNTVRVRRHLLICAAAISAVGVFSAPSAAFAEPRAVCSIDDERLPELTGITAIPGGGYMAVTRQPAFLRMYKIDGACKATRVLNDQSVEPRAIEDIARTPDGAFWIGDIGDIDLDRPTLMISKVAPGATRATKFRLQYPDTKYDAAAFVMQPNGVPVILTREVPKSGSDAVVKIFTTAGPLAPGTTAMKAAGTFTVPKSTTPGGALGKVGQALVSGASLSPDGKKVVVRTYTDAYEWDIEGDVATTLASGKAPRATPLPNEGRGEAITYTTDGAGFVTGSMSQPSPLLEWAPAPLPAPSAATKPTTSTEAADDEPSFFSSLTLGQLGGLIQGVGAVGLLMLIGGIVGIVRFRRAQREPEEASLDVRMAEARSRNHSGVPDIPPAEATVSLPRVGADQAMTAVHGAEAPTRGTVYGSPAAGGGPAGRRATVYGGRPEASPQQEKPRGTVYGGTTYGAEPTPPSAAPRGTTYGGGAANPSDQGGTRRPAGQVYGRPAGTPQASPAAQPPQRPSSVAQPQRPSTAQPPQRPSTVAQPPQRGPGHRGSARWRGRATAEPHRASPARCLRASTAAPSTAAGPPGGERRARVRTTPCTRVPSRAPRETGAPVVPPPRALPVRLGETARRSRF